MFNGIGYQLIYYAAWKVNPIKNRLWMPGKHQKFIRLWQQRYNYFTGLGDVDSAFVASGFAEYSQEHGWAICNLHI